jgi:acetate kinase
MRVLEAKQKDPSDRLARLAIEMVCYRARKYVGSYLAAMGGAKAVIFTGGIGANSPGIRLHICKGLEWFGLEVSETKNSHLNGTEGCITTERS